MTGLMWSSTLVQQNGVWFPVAITQWCGYRRAAETDARGRIVAYDRRAYADLRSFAGTLLTNIKEQQGDLSRRPDLARGARPPVTRTTERAPSPSRERPSLLLGTLETDGLEPRRKRTPIRSHRPFPRERRHPGRVAPLRRIRPHRSPHTATGTAPRRGGCPAAPCGRFPGSSRLG